MMICWVARSLRVLPFAGKYPELHAAATPVAMSSAAAAAAMFCLIEYALLKLREVLVGSEKTSNSTNGIRLATPAAGHVVALQAIRY